VDTLKGSIYTHDVSGTDSTAQYNTAFGLTAMDAITTGDQNTSIGYGAGVQITTGAEQVNIGYQAGLVCTSSGKIGKMLVYQHQVRLIYSKQVMGYRK
jgi:hypothetical protein